MKPAPSGSDATGKPLIEVDCLVSDDDRRTISIDDHAAFRESIAPPAGDFDEIDLAVDPLLLDHPVQRRKGKEISQLMSILDELDGNEKGRGR